MSASTRSLDLAEPLPQRALWAFANALQLAFTLLWTAGGICVALLLRWITGDARVPLRMASWFWARGLLTGAGARLDVRGVEHVDWSKPCILVATHESIIDVCALFRVVPVPLRFMLKREMARAPFVGAYAKAMGMCFVARNGDRAATVKAMRDAAGIVDAGHVLCIFPEGTRTKNGRVGAFKAGAFQVALATGAPVVPVALTGSGAILPPNGFRVRPGTIRVRIGTPIVPEGRGAEARDRLAAQAREAVVALMAGE